MRDITFRGFNKENKKWVYGNLIEDIELGYCIRTFPEGLFKYKDIPIDPESIGQFTGLKDRNRKDIYEGDKYIDSWNNIEIIEFSIIKQSNIVGHGNREELIYCGFNLKYVPDNLEIIGNIYENPELMECKNV